MSNKHLLIMGALCVAQNFTFTFVSRARNSGSLRRHLIAAMLSNAIWFVAASSTMKPMLALAEGNFNSTTLTAGIVYTIATVLGSISAHWWALRSEKGSGRVGANAKLAQISLDEWDLMTQRLDKLEGLCDYGGNHSRVNCECDPHEQK